MRRLSTAFERARGVLAAFRKRYGISFAQQSFGAIGRVKGR